MPNVCILTDSTAQFTQAGFPGHERVHVIPFAIQKAERQGGRPQPGSTPVHAQLIPPTPQEFIQFYAGLSRTFDSILVLTLSSMLSPVMRAARTASEQYKNGVPVEVMDSQTTSIGLGMLVQIAAGAASEGASLKEIDWRLRASLPRVYMLLCIPDLTFLAYFGHVEHAQALVGEMLGILPIFTFEDGRLVPMEKVRTPRHLFEAFQDFMSEFEDPVQVALVHGPEHGSLRTGPLRQFVNDTFPEAFFSEYPVPAHLAALFGPRSIGLVVLESADERRK